MVRYLDRIETARCFFTTMPNVPKTMTHYESDTVLTLIVPPASRILVIIVASIAGVQPVKVSVPTRHGTPATQTLSLMQRFLPCRRVEDGAL